MENITPTEFLVKKTKRIRMYYDSFFKTLKIQTLELNGETVVQTILLDRREIYPVLRGLVSVSQRFYRKEDKKNGKTKKQ